VIRGVVSHDITTSSNGTIQECRFNRHSGEQARGGYFKEGLIENFLLMVIFY